LLALAAGMDVELPTVYGYGQVLARAVRDGKAPESLLDRSVRRVLRDKFALGLFENPYVPENPAEIRTVAREGVELSKRLAAASVTLLKNENGLLPLGRDIAKIAIVGPHADDVEVGFTTYMYANALKMYHARATGGDIAMAGVGLGAPPPPEAKAALAAETGAAFKVDRREYLKSNYAAMSLAEAVSSPTVLPCRRSVRWVARALKLDRPRTCRTRSRSSTRLNM
jgi:beta-glucosidase